MRPFRFGWLTSILFALVSYGLAGVANAQPAGAPPAAPPPAAEPAPMAPPPAETAPPPAYVPVAPAIAMPPPVPAPSTTPAIPSVAPLKIEGRNASIRFGMFLQPQFESAQVTAANGYANNLYLRRARVIIGGTLFDNIEYFMETDSPNLFKGATAPLAMGQTQALKLTSTMVIQDMFGTFKAMGDMVKIDAGYTLPAGSHNSMQSAFTLFGWDYFAYTFVNSNAFGAATAPVGRDLGVQLRGLLLDKHLEYRAGIWQGQRNAAVVGEQSARNFFRTAARLQVNVFDPETGYYYAGTYLGAKKILSFGGSYDFESDYKSYSFDGFLDMPLGPGVVTAQVDYSHWDGGGYVPLDKQWAVQGEVGYTFLPIAVSPIVRVEHFHDDTPAPRLTPFETQNRYGGGLAYWCYGHNSNLKVFYTRIQQDGAAHGANQFNVQWQIFLY